MLPCNSLVVACLRTVKFPYSKCMHENLYNQYRLPKLLQQAYDLSASRCAVLPLKQFVPSCGDRTVINRS